MDHYFDTCRVLLVFSFQPYFTLGGISTTIGCHLLQSFNCVADTVLSISIKHHLSINLDIPNSWFILKPFNSIRSELRSLVPRKMLDISITVCRRTVIIATQSFKVECVTHVLMSVVAQFSQASLFNRNKSSNNNGPVNFLFDQWYL